MKKLLNGFCKDNKGQDLVEYALLLVLMALGAIVTLPALSSAVNTLFSKTASTLTTGS